MFRKHDLRKLGNVGEDGAEENQTNNKSVNVDYFIEDDAISAEEESDKYTHNNIIDKTDEDDKTEPLTDNVRDDDGEDQTGLVKVRDDVRECRALPSSRSQLYEIEHSTV